jgi:hypothetical protein
MIIYKFIKLKINNNLKKKKNSPQDGRQMVEVKFNSYKIIPHYYNNKFALHMHTISALILNTFNTAIH